MKLCSKSFTNTSSWNSRDSCVRCCYWLVTYLQIPFTHVIQSWSSHSTLKWFSNNSLCTKIQTSPFWHARKTLLPSTHQAWEILCHKQNPLIHVCLHTCYPVCLSFFKVSFFKSYFNCYFSWVLSWLSQEESLGAFFPMFEAHGMFYYSIGKGRGKEKKRKRVPLTTCDVNFRIKKSLKMYK